MTARRNPLAAACLVALTSIAWLDPHQAVRDANRLYADGKYEDAAAAYNAALVDKPDSAELHFNLGDTVYKQGKYDEAVTSFQKVETAGDPARGARVAYNTGNTKYRQGQAVEQSEPQKALGLYAEALASYRRALGLAPDDQDVKFNHELVAKHIEELKKKLEEQKQQQEQQKQDQPQDQQQDQEKQEQDQQQEQGQQDQQQQDQQEQQQDEEKQDQAQQQQEQEQQDEQQGGEQEQQKPEEAEQPEQQQAGQEPSAGDEKKQPPEQPPGAPAGEAVAGDEQEGDLSKGEAAAILDSQRGEEVSPEDMIKKRLQGARVAEPAQDW